MKKNTVGLCNVLFVIGGLLAFLCFGVSLMGCQPRSPALNAMDKQMTDLEARQEQARAMNAALASQSEEQKKLICLQAASGVGYAQFQVFVLQGFGIFCKAGE